MGQGTTASGAFSFAVGSNNSATANMGVVFGQSNQNFGTQALVGGLNSYTYGQASFIWGRNCSILSLGAAAFGEYNTVDNSSQSSFVAGYTNALVNAGFAAVFGKFNSANAQHAFAAGNNNTIDSFSGAVFGEQNFSRAAYEFNIGAWGTDYTPTASATDRMFNIGGGNNTGGITTRSDLFSVYKNGGVQLKPVATAPANPSAGMVYFDSSDNKMKCYDGTIWNNLF